MADFLRFRWAIDERGDPHVWHRCDGQVLVFQLPSTEWRVVADGHGEVRVEPSLRCDRCGAHGFLLSCDRVPFRELIP